MSNTNGLAPARIRHPGLTFFFGWACFAVAIFCAAASVEGGAGAFAFASVFFSLSLILLCVGLLTSLFQRIELRLIDIQAALHPGEQTVLEPKLNPSLLDDGLSAMLDLRD